MALIGAAWKEGQLKANCELTSGLFRQAGIVETLKKNLGIKVEDYGDVSQDRFSNDKEGLLELSVNERMKVVGKLNEQLSHLVHKASKQSQKTLIIGGDHSLGTGSIHGQLLTHGDDLKVLWIDAHADINTPLSSSSGNYHGMPVAHLMGMFDSSPSPDFQWLSKRLKPSNLAYIGIRDLDPAEKMTIQQNGIRYYSMFDLIHMGGLRNVVDDAFDYLKVSKGQNPLHVSFDVDALDADSMQLTGTPVRNGLSFREANYIMQRAYRSDSLVGLDVAEFNPMIDGSATRQRDHKEISGFSTETPMMSSVMDIILHAFGYEDV